MLGEFETPEIRDLASRDVGLVLISPGAGLLVIHICRNPPVVGGKTGGIIHCLESRWESSQLVASDFPHQPVLSVGSYFVRILLCSSLDHLKLFPRALKQ